jgi:hypothetical protein
MPQTSYKINVKFPSGATFDKTVFGWCLEDAAERAIRGCGIDHAFYRQQEYGAELVLPSDDEAGTDALLEEGYRFNGWYGPFDDEFIPARKTDFGQGVLPEHQEKYRAKGARLIDGVPN